MKEYSVGIDSGSVATKAVLFDGQKIIKKVIIPTGWSPKKTSLQAYEMLTDGIDKDIPFEEGKKIVLEALKPLGDKYINDLNDEGNAKPNGIISGIDTFFFSFCFDVNYEDEDYLYCNSSKITVLSSFKLSLVSPKNLENNIFL